MPSGTDARHGLDTVGQMAVALYRRAPASVMTLGSLALSYLVTLAYEDYRLFMALGQGGLGKPSVWTWLIHTFALRPFAMPRRAALDPDCMPLDDEEWNGKRERLGGLLATLPERQGRRPLVYGMVPHRQLEAIAPEGGPMQKAIIAHLGELAARFPDALTLALSTYEATNSPCLFVRHGSSSTAEPTAMARLYLSGTPCPKRSLSNNAEMPDDPTAHELAHIHLSEGSLHLILSPQDARKVIGSGWGERHRLAGMAYRGHYLPPYWLPSWLYRLGGGEARMRWGYQKRLLADTTSPSPPKGKLIPPTYTCIYAPTTDEQLRWTKLIIESSIAWALGRSIG